MYTAQHSIEFRCGDIASLSEVWNLAKKETSLMVTELGLRERQKNHLGSLLKIKKALGEQDLPILRQEIEREIMNAIIGMLQEDVALVEKIVGIKAM